MKSNLPHLAVLDIEAKELVKDWNKPWEAGLSVCCTWVNWRGGPYGTYLFHSDQQLDKLADVLSGADVVVTKNGARYDLPVLSYLHDKIEGKPLPVREHCDLQLIVQRAVGYRVKLEDLARATLRRGKSGHGDMAPDMYQRGDFTALCTYNLDDVSLTRDLYLFAFKHGFLFVPGKAGPEPVPVDVTPANRNAVRGRKREARRA